MHILSENTSPTPGSSYVYLCGLQRGLTNAVIQDISFSSDSQWIMISSSRGTSHLFTISPSRETVNFDLQMHVYRMDMHLVSWKNLQFIVPQIQKIRNGGNGWKNTVTGAAAAATGRMITTKSIASAFHHCNSTSQYADSDLKANYRLLVFSSLGCMTQYTLHICSQLDSATTIPAVGSTYVAALERRLGRGNPKVEYFPETKSQRTDDNADIYGEFVCSDSSKVFPEGITKGNGLYSETRDTITKDKIRSEEGHHIYISEAELQMHKPQFQLWAKSKVFFQSFVMDRICVLDGCGGEVEIEVIPTQDK